MRTALATFPSASSDKEIRGALTTDPKSKINPATPRLADLVWTRDSIRRRSVTLGGRILIDRHAGQRQTGCGKGSVQGKSVEWQSPENSWIGEVYANGDLVGCLMHGSPVSELPVFDIKLGKWATFTLPQEKRPRDADPVVGTHVACYRLDDCIIAYSGKTHTWDLLAAGAQPAVGDDSILVETITEKSQFSADMGKWVTQEKPRKGENVKGVGDKVSGADLYLTVLKDGRGSALRPDAR